ncbi:RimK family alpha-L-glutamate ligase [Cellulosilyticum ruminicola]|uniref:RimK family alpha-L-glutamate ligase n=1 Tax=Cellulosilyticum ruminicola TaxID=425254 RepID=UPI0006CFD989|nr:RimK family alpha-L-glutamate ligase [Cellulosilyticum ruminicola]
MQKTGWMITNSSLKTAQFKEMCEMYAAAAEQVGLKLIQLYNDEIMMGLNEGELFLKGIKVEERPDFILFLDKDIRLAKQLEGLGFRLFNNSDVIAACDDKSLTFQRLAGHGIKMPKTIIAPFIFYGQLSNEVCYLQPLEEQIGYPMIVKESFGSFGEQVYMVKNRDELIKIREEVGSKPHIYQEYIASSKGRDVRLNVVGGKLVACMERYSETDFRANIAQGGGARPFDPPQAFIEMATKVCKILAIDFAGVDLLFGENGEPILCEVNSNAHIKGIKACTGINVAVPILEHIKASL